MEPNHIGTSTNAEVIGSNLMAYASWYPLDSPDNLHVVIATYLACSFGEVANTNGRIDEVVDISVANAGHLSPISATDQQ